MKILALLLPLLISVSAQAENFSVSRECRNTIKADLNEQGLTLTRINSATYYAGGSDGASSYDSEFIINAYVKDAQGNSSQVLISINDSYNCRVGLVSKVY